MFHFGSSSHEGRYYALYDICSASIGVGIVFCKEKTVELVWHKRVEFGYHSTDDYNRYVRTMYATLLEVGMKLTSDGFKTVSSQYPSFSARNVEVVCVLGQPWFLGSVITETQSKEKSFTVSSDLLQELQNSGLSKVLEKQESVSWQEVMGTPKPLEVYTDVVRLEGYPVHNYLRRTTNELSVQFYFGIVSTSVQEHIDEVLKRVLPNHEIFFMTATRAFATLEAMYTTKLHQRSVLIEITGEITSVSILKKRTVLGVITIPLGTNHVMKALAPNAVSAEEARGLLDVVRKKNATSDFEALPPELQETLGIWKDAVTKSINTLGGGVTPPTNVTIVVDTVWYQLYKVSIEKPWEMPGARIVQGSIVDHITPQIGEEATKEGVSSQDARLFLLTRLLPSCTQEKGMWYTEK
jgi:hypothetical protein